MRIPSVPAAVALISAIALVAAAPAAASFPGRNGRLVLADYSRTLRSDQPSRDALVTVRADGTHARRLLTMPGVTDPSWSADGRRIVFAARTIDDRFAVNSYEIFTVRSDGSHLRRLTHNSVADLSPSWSRSGHSIALVRVRFDGYYRRAPDTAELRMLRIRDGQERLVVHGPVQEASLSPDASVIAYSTGKDVFVVRPTGGESRFVATLPDAELNGDLSWQPTDGGTVLFTDYNGGPCDETCTEGVWSVFGAQYAFLNSTYTPNQPVRITPFGSGATRNGIYSPDGREIDYCQPGGGWPIGWYLATMRADGTRAHQVAQVDGCPSDWQALPPKKRPKRR